MGVRIGIDPGISGAIAVLCDGRIHQVIDMPTMQIKVGKSMKNQVSAPVLANMLRAFKEQEPVVCVEKVSAMPGQGVSSMFGFGRSLGVIEGVCAGLGLPISYATPQSWQKRAQVRGGKDGGRARAAELHPDSAALFSRVKDDGRADAVLIAQFGLEALS